MATPRLISIMRSRGSPFPDDLLRKMSDMECWTWIYRQDWLLKQQHAAEKPKHIICFSGFHASRKTKLQQLASDQGWKVSRSICKTSTFLCIGETPGPKKISKAKEQGTSVITEAEFLTLLKSTL
jgi:NAD-dependent DNA ligase